MLGCFSIAVMNAMTECNLERKGFTSSYGLSSVKGSQGRNREAGTEGGALEERLLTGLIHTACSAFLPYIAQHYFPRGWPHLQWAGLSPPKININEENTSTDLPTGQSDEGYFFSCP